MNRLESGSLYSPSDLGGSRGAPAHGARKTYDDLAGSALLRRSGKNAAGGAPLRGDQAATLLAARRKNEGDDRIGHELRDFYQTMLREPVPERFVALVDALEAQGR